MSEYNPKAPNKLADAQLNRANYESDASKAVAKHHAGDGAVLDNTDAGPSFTNKESYNSIPGE
ncbi:MAG: hypothetical protein UHX00_13695 [Caryophanon sp.]|nr:hypothetical protein [Caryophanon sp.]